jgi:enterochelin esterase-like enzyme
MLIYTPPDYTAARQYPVLYLLHGAGDGEDAWTSSGLADVILDNLYHAKQILPMLVVMPRGRVSADPRPRLAPAQEIQAWAALEHELLKDIIPYVDSHFSVRSEPASRALAGLSMGGGQSLNIGLKHPETFSWVAAFSSAPNTRPLSELVTASNQLQNLRLLWLSCGEHDQLLKLNQSFHDALAKQNVTHIWKLGPGSHEWPVWKSDLYFLSQKLFQPPGTN